MAKKQGICRNIDCDNYKQVVEIEAGEEFECPLCHQHLDEVEKKQTSGSKTGNKRLISIIAGVVVLLAIIGGIIAFSGGDEDKPAPAPVPEVSENTDSIKAALEAAEQQRIKDSLDAVAAAEAAKKQEAEKKTEPVPAAQKPAKPASGSKNLGYATFKGSWPNDVKSRMVFTSSHVIDSKDPKKRVAEAGDYVIGEWSDGHLVQGIWYGADNQVKGSIIIGK